MLVNLIKQRLEDLKQEESPAIAVVALEVPGTISEPLLDELELTGLIVLDCGDGYVDMFYYRDPTLPHEMAASTMLLSILQKIQTLFGMQQSLLCHSCMMVLKSSCHSARSARAETAELLFMSSCYLEKARVTVLSMPA